MDDKFEDMDLGNFSYEYEHYYGEEDEFPWHHQAAKNILLYVSPLLIFPGTVGNVLTIVVLQSALFKNTPCGFLLSALAASDIGVLNCNLLRKWIMEVTRKHTTEWLDVRCLSNSGCKAHIFFTYFFPQLSSWTLVLVTIDRVVSVVVPLRSREICTQVRMIAAWVVTAGLLALFNIYPTLNHHFEVWTFANISMKMCQLVVNEGQNEDDVKDAFNTQWGWTDFILFALLPLILISAGNSIIIYKMYQARMARQHSLSVRQTRGKKHQGSKNMHSATVMLVVLNIAFLVTTIPRSVYFLGLPWKSLGALKLDFFNAVAYTMYYTSNAINFLLYCVSGTRFRQAMHNVFCCRDASGRKRSFLSSFNSSGRATRFSSVSSSNSKRRKPSYQTQVSNISQENSVVPSSPTDYTTGKPGSYNNHVESVL